MNIEKYLKLTLAMAVLGVATGFICAYSLCGILFNKVIAIIFGVTLLLITGYYGFFIYKTLQSGLQIIIFLGVIDAFIFVSAILCFTVSKTLFSEKSDMSQFAYSLFIALGLFFCLGIQWPNLLRIVFNDILDQLGFSEIVQYSLCFICNLLSAIVSSLLIGLAPDKSDSKMLTECSLRAIGACFIAATIAAIVGFVMQIGNQSINGPTPAYDKTPSVEPENNYT